MKKLQTGFVVTVLAFSLLSGCRTKENPITAGNAANNNPASVAESLSPSAVTTPYKNVNTANLDTAFASLKKSIEQKKSNLRNP